MRLEAKKKIRCGAEDKGEEGTRQCGAEPGSCGTGRGSKVFRRKDSPAHGRTAACGEEGRRRQHLRYRYAR